MDMEQRLDAVVSTAIAEKRIVETMLMVRQNGRVLYEKAHGLAAVRPGGPWRWMRFSGCRR